MITMNGGPLSYGGYVLSNEDLTVYGGKNAFYVESNEPLKNKYFEFTSSPNPSLHPTGFIFGDDELYTSTARNYRTNGGSVYITGDNNKVIIAITYNNSEPTYVVRGVQIPITGDNITSLIIDDNNIFYIYSNGELAYTYDTEIEFPNTTRVFMTRGWDSYTTTNTFNFGDQGEGFKYKNIYDFYFKDLYKLYNKDDSVYGLE